MSLTSKPYVSYYRVSIRQQGQSGLGLEAQQAAVRTFVSDPAGIVAEYVESGKRNQRPQLQAAIEAAHHPDRVPVVHVTYAQEGEYHVLAVQDNGLGMDLRQGPGRLFAMFQRLHTHVEGSGLGLYMVKRMIENAAGRIEVQSEPELGTTFRVYFPMK